MTSAARSIFLRGWILGGLALISFGFAQKIPPRLNIPTGQYNRRRTGANLHETRLTPANVNSRDFGKLFSLPADGQVYAQPLYLSHLFLPGHGYRNVIFVATEGDSVYAFDAGGRTRKPFWQVHFTDPARGITTVPASDLNCDQITPQVGITATPVISPRRRALYVVSRTRIATAHGVRYLQQLHALDLATGRELFGGPVTIAASAPGTGDGSRNGRVYFDARRNNARAALLLSRGQVYIAFASPCDAIPYHGWILAYSAATLRQTAVFTPSPDGNDGGIWQSGAGLAAGHAGHIYAAIGNGAFDAAAHPPRPDYGDSVLRLGYRAGRLAVLDFFTPYNHHALNLRDGDLGSGGPVLLPGKLLEQTGKGGTIYLLNRNHLGGAGAGQDQIVESLPHAIGGMWGNPAYWNGNLYFAPAGGRMRQFQLRNGKIAAQPAAETKTKFYYPGATPVVSANGHRDGIVWALQLGAYKASGFDQPPVLRAYSAINIGRQLYSSRENARRDTPGGEVKFASPLVAAGRVYVPTQNGVSVYGLLASGSPQVHR